MIVVICGSRFIKKMQYVEQAVEEAKISGEVKVITEIVSGAAPGVDTLAIDYADAHKIDKTLMPANWPGRGKGAGFHRNTRMVKYADAVIAVWDGISNGTKDTIDKAKRKGIPVFIKVVTDHKH